MQYEGKLFSMVWVQTENTMFPKLRKVVSLVILQAFKVINAKNISTLKTDFSTQPHNSNDRRKTYFKSRSRLQFFCYFSCFILTVQTDKSARNGQMRNIRIIKMDLFTSNRRKRHKYTFCNNSSANE